MIRLLAPAPRWLTWMVIAAVTVGVLAIAGWIKPYLAGADAALVTVYRPKPVPMRVETVKWLTRVETRTQRERVEVPVEVIRELPAKEAKRIEQDFGIRLPELREENRALVDVLAIPRAPRGGDLAVTVNTASGAIDGVFKAHRMPFVEVGGLREVGVEYDVVGRNVAGYYRQDLVRIGPAIVNGRVFAAAPVNGGEFDAGATLGVAVRF